MNRCLLVLSRIQGSKLIYPVNSNAVTFNVGRVNSTSTLRSLTEINGIKIEDLEEIMRPSSTMPMMVKEQHKDGSSVNRISQEGFLGENEKLLDIMADDNSFVVDEKGLSHQQIALPLLEARRAVENYRSLTRKIPWPKKRENFVVQFKYNGSNYIIQEYGWLGYQQSPFGNDGLMGSIDFTITNVETGEKLVFSELAIDLIYHYGFYEGKQTPYRVEPARLIHFFNIKK